MRELIKDIEKYHELIWALALKELKIRYKRSVLGFLWALLNPLLTMIVLTVVFTAVMPGGLPHYAVFILSALVPWTFFSQSVTYAAESIVGNADLIKKVAVAKAVFPFAAVISNLVNLLLSLIPLALVVLVSRHPFYWTWILLPIPLIALTIFTTGFSLFLAAVNVFYRDVSHITQIVLQLWFYVTPIIYTLDVFHGRFLWLFRLNPIIYVLNDIRMFVYYGMMPTASSVMAAFGTAFLAFAIGYWVFHKHESEFVFYI